MRWQLLILSSVSAALTVGGGCGASRPLLTPEARQALAQPGMSPAPTVTRSQKGDKVVELRPVTLLNPVTDQSGVGAGGVVAARIRATVNSVPIFEEEVQASSYQFVLQLRGIPEPEYSRKRRAIEKEMLDQLIERELILQSATERLKKAGPKVLKRLKESAHKEFDRRWVRTMKKGNNIKSDEEFKEMLARQGLSLEMISRQWVRQFMATEYLRSNVMRLVERPGHEQLLEFYEQHLADFKVEDSVQWQDIFLSAANPKYATRAAGGKVAEELVQRVRNGEDFAILCKQYDDGNSADNGGKGVGEKRGEILPPEVEPHLFAMSDGEVGPVVEIGTGFHIIRLVKRERAGVRPFHEEKVQTQIRNKLRNEAYTRETRKVIADLKSKAVIEYARPGR